MLVLKGWIGEYYFWMESKLADSDGQVKER